MKTRSFVICAATVLGLGGCFSITPSITPNVRYEPLLDIKAVSRPVSEVIAFQTKSPSRPYDEVGVLTYRAGTAETYADVVTYFREKAAQIGADGVIIMGSTAGPSMTIGGMVANLTDYRGMVIRYK